MGDDTLVSVYRRQPISPAQASMVVRYARQQIGKRYDVSGAIGGGATSTSGSVISVFLGPIATVGGRGADAINRINPERSFYCSELVALAFKHANVPLVKDPVSATPYDISHSHVLKYVGVLKQVNKLQDNPAASRNDVVILRRAIHGKLYLFTMYGVLS